MNKYIYSFLILFYFQNVGLFAQIASKLEKITEDGFEKCLQGTIFNCKDIFYTNLSGTFEEKILILKNIIPLAGISADPNSMNKKASNLKSQILESDKHPILFFDSFALYLKVKFERMETDNKNNKNSKYLSYDSTLKETALYGVYVARIGLAILNEYHNNRIPFTKAPDFRQIKEISNIKENKKYKGKVNNCENCGITSLKLPDNLAALDSFFVIKIEQYQKEIEKEIKDTEKFQKEINEQIISLNNLIEKTKSLKKRHPSFKAVDIKRYENTKLWESRTMSSKGFEESYYPVFNFSPNNRCDARTKELVKPISDTILKVANSYEQNITNILEKLNAIDTLVQGTPIELFNKLDSQDTLTLKKYKEGEFKVIRESLTESRKLQEINVRIKGKADGNGYNSCISNICPDLRKFKTIVFEQYSAGYWGSTSPISVFQQKNNSQESKVNLKFYDESSYLGDHCQNKDKNKILVKGRNITNLQLAFLRAICAGEYMYDSFLMSNTLTMISKKILIEYQAYEYQQQLSDKDRGFDIAINYKTHNFALDEVMKDLDRIKNILVTLTEKDIKDYLKYLEKVRSQLVIKDFTKLTELFIQKIKIKK